MTAMEQRTVMKELRRRIALANEVVPLTADRPCEEGCRGACPVCKAEARWLDDELNRLAAEGKTITLAAVTLEDLLEEEPAPVAEIVEPAREEPFSGSLLDMPLEDLDLSLRTRVSLEGHGVTTLRQLLQMTPSDCRKVRNMTQEGLDEIEYQLGLMRFSLKDEY